MSSPPSKKKEIIKHLRFELTVKEHQAFYYVGQELLKIKKKHDILKEMIRLIKERYNET